MVRCAVCMCVCIKTSQGKRTCWLRYGKRDEFSTRIVPPIPISAVSLYIPCAKFIRVDKKHTNHCKDLMFATVTRHVVLCKWNVCHHRVPTLVYMSYIYPYKGIHTYIGKVYKHINLCVCIYEAFFHSKFLCHHHHHHLPVPVPIPYPHITYMKYSYIYIEPTNLFAMRCGLLLRIHAI